MTISALPQPVWYNGDGATVEFATGFKYYDKSDVSVIHVDASDTETTWVLDTDYTLDAAGDESGGDVTAVTAPESGEKLRIWLNVPFTQPTAFANYGAFSPDSTEQALDESLQRDAVLQDQADRALMRGVTTDSDWDADTRKIENVTDPTAAQDAATKAYADNIAMASGNVPAPVNPTDDGKALTAGGGGFTWEDQTGGDVVDDTTPQLGGNLDANAFNIDFDDATGIRDESGNEQLIFNETASAVNHVGFTNAATAGNPKVAAEGDDTNITLDIEGKGSGLVNLGRHRWRKGSDIASATALTLGTDGNYFDVTGATAITSIGDVATGMVVKLQFDGALTLTHHSIDLILPGGANITTAAGDEAEFFQYATGDWRCTNYQKASGQPVSGGGAYTLLKRTVAASDSSIDFDDSDPDIDFTAYDAYEIHVIAAHPSATTNFVYGRVQQTTWKTDAKYEWGLPAGGSGQAVSYTYSGGTPETALVLADSSGWGLTWTSGAENSLNGKIWLPNFGTADHRKIIQSDFSWWSSSDTTTMRTFGNGTYDSNNTAMTGFQIYPSAGVWVTGTFLLFGVNLI